jgi:hypothetical protein
MRTEAREVVRFEGWRAVAVVSLLGVAAVLLKQHGGAGNASSAPMPIDFVSAGLQIESLDAEASGVISLDEALRSIADAYGGDFREADIEGYLVKLTDPATLGGAIEIRDRPIWLMRASGFSTSGYGSILADTTGDTAGGSMAHIYVDAMTGEWLMTRVLTDSP